MAQQRGRSILIIYLTNKELIKSTIDEASKKENGSSSQKRIIIQLSSREGKAVEASCLVVAKLEKIPKIFFLIYHSITHKIDSTNEYYFSPLNEEGVLIDPQKDII